MPSTGSSASVEVDDVKVGEEMRHERKREDELYSEVLREMGMSRARRMRMDPRGRRMRDVRGRRRSK